jgi:hypothetical protein
LFDALSKYRTLITQRFVLSGNNATAYVNQVRLVSVKTFPTGLGESPMDGKGSAFNRRR